MQNKTDYFNPIPFLDLILNTLLTFVVLFALSFLLITESKKEEQATARGEFLVSCSWEDDSRDDVDLYVEDSQGNLCFFRARESGFMSLDRDDTGYHNETIKTPFGEVAYNKNNELITIRGIVPGEYCVCVHMYSKLEPESAKVTVKLEKVNPYSVIFVEEVELERAGNEAFVKRFTIDENGLVSKISTLPKSLTGKR